MRLTALATLIGCLSVGQAAAQPASIGNATVETRALSGPLDAAIERHVAGTAGPAWIAYEVPVIAGDHFMCEWSETTRRAPPATAVKLEGPSVVRVFYRVEHRAVTRIRMFSDGCSIDAGGRPVLWLSGVPSAESVALLRSFAGTGGRRVADGALSSIAMHADPTALDAMIEVARAGSTAHARGQALFWLAQRAGDEAVGAISEALARDPDTDVKKRAVFALSQLPKSEGVPKLIDVARLHSNPAVRRQAMFWLGQSRDPRALAFFQEILAK